MPLKRLLSTLPIDELFLGADVERSMSTELLLTLPEDLAGSRDIPGICTREDEATSTTSMSST
jgi:hypothetical protein